MAKTNQDMTLAERKQEKRNRILTAAMEVFADKGFSKTPMAQVAVRADVGKGTLYEYFSSKEELYFEVFQSYVQGIFGMLLDIARSQSGNASASQVLENLHAAIMTQLREARQHYGLFLEFWSASASSGQRHRFHEEFRNMYRNCAELLAEVVGKGARSGEFRSDVDTMALGRIIVGAWDAMGLQAWFDDSFSLDDTARTLLDVVLAGLKPACGQGT